MKSFDTILSAILASAGFLFSLILFEFGIIASVIIGGLFFVAGYFLFEAKTKIEEDKEFAMEEALKMGNSKLSEIKSLGKAIKQQNLKEKITKICEITEKILAEVKRDPSDLKRAKQFLNYYLDSTIKIVSTYVKLATTEVNDKSIKDYMVKIETMLDTLAQAFDKQLAMLLSNDVMDLDVELSLLESMIKSENLGN